MPKLPIAIGLALLAYVAVTVNSVQTSVTQVVIDTGKVTATKSAIVGTSCASCHGVDSNNMLPIRKTLNEETFSKWVRGNRNFHGYTACPIPTYEEIKDSDIKKMYRILYGK